MSGSRSKAKRRAQRERPAYLANANYALRSADAVLSVDLSAVPLTLVNQFAVGWMRAAFEQSRVIANLTAAGKGHVAAPNRRTLWELSLRLHWLADMPQSKREPAANAMLAHERSTVAKTDKHMRDMGVESDIDIAAMNDFILNVSEDPKVTRRLEGGSIRSIWSSRSPSANPSTCASRSSRCSSVTTVEPRPDSSWLRTLASDHPSCLRSASAPAATASERWRRTSAASPVGDLTDEVATRSTVRRPQRRIHDGCHRCQENRIDRLSHIADRSWIFRFRAVGEAARLACARHADSSPRRPRSLAVSGANGIRWSGRER